MKLNKKTLAPVFASILLIIMLVGCSSELSGRWASASGSGTQISFSPGGVVVMFLGKEELASGTYTTNNNRLTMALTDPKGEVHVIDADYHIEGRKLFLTNSKGFTETFVRR